MQNSSQSNVLQFTVSPTLYNWQIAVDYFRLGSLVEVVFSEAAATLAQAEAMALANFNLYFGGASVNLANSAVAGPAN